MEYAWILSQFGKDKKIAKNSYHEYTEGGLKVEERTLLRSLHGQVLLGREEFIGIIKEMLRGRQFPQEIVERKKLTEYPFPMEVVDEVSEAFGKNR